MDHRVGLKSIKVKPTNDNTALSGGSSVSEGKEEHEKPGG